MAQTGRIVWTEQINGFARTADTHGLRVTDVAPNARGPHAMDAGGATGQAFFVEVNTGDIRRVNFHGTGAQTVITMQGGIGGLDIDPVNGHIYITGSGAILRTNLNGSGLATLYNSPNGDLLDVAIDQTNQEVYWTGNRNHKVQRADFSGANVTDILTTGLSTPIGIDVLPSLGEIYIVNKGRGWITSADLQGSNAQATYSNPSSCRGLAAVVPAPGSGALVVLGGVWLGRRRCG